MEFADRLLICSDCGGEFVFTAGEQLFFFDKQFKNDPKRCKPCKSKKVAGPPRPGAPLMAVAVARTETRTECSACGVATTVPFKPTQGRPVLCRQCFQARQIPVAAISKNQSVPSATAQMNTATAELVAAASSSEHHTAAAMDMVSLPAAV